MRIRKKDRVLTIFAIIFVVLFIALIVISIISSREKKVDYSNMTDEEISSAVKEQIDEMKKNELGDMGERDRMEHYVSSFVQAMLSLRECVLSLVSVQCVRFLRILRW